MQGRQTGSCARTCVTTWPTAGSVDTPLNEDVADHASLSRIRDRLGEEIFVLAFQRIVEQCRKKKLVQQDCRVMTDPTLIAADAALDSLVHQDPDVAKQEAVALHGRTKNTERPASRKLSNPTHASHTDPDATLAQKHGPPRQLKYEVHQSIDGDSRVVLDTHVTTGGRHDNQPYMEQLQRIADQYGIRVVEAMLIAVMVRLKRSKLRCVIRRSARSCRSGYGRSRACSPRRSEIIVWREPSIAVAPKCRSKRISAPWRKTSSTWSFRFTSGCDACL